MGRGIAAAGLLLCAISGPVLAQKSAGDAELLCAVDKLKGDTAYKQCLAAQGRQAAPKPPKPAAAPTAKAPADPREVDCALEKLRGADAYQACLGGRAAPRAVEAAPVLKGPEPEPAIQQQQAQAARFPVWKAPATALPAAASAPLTAAELFKQLSSSVYVVLARSPITPLPAERNLSQGSAVAVTSDTALTNCHVLGGHAEHFIVHDDKLWPVSVISADSTADKCIIRSSQLRLVPVRSARRADDLAVGEKASTIGTPSGYARTLGEGLVSGLRARDGQRIIQTSAPTSPGSSGGGLFDGAGNLIGITSFKAKDAENISLAIAVEEFWR